MLLNRMPERRKAAMPLASYFWLIRFARCVKLLKSVKHGNDKGRTLVNATLSHFSLPDTGLNPGNKPVYYVIKLRQIFEDLCRGDSELIDTIR